MFFVGVSSLRDDSEDQLDGRIDPPISKSRCLGGIRDIEYDPAGLVFAMFLDKIVESVLATTNGCDFDARLDESVGHGTADACRGADKENVFVGEGHFVGDAGFRFMTCNLRVRLIQT